MSKKYAYIYDLYAHGYIRTVGEGTRYQVLGRYSERERSSV